MSSFGPALEHQGEEVQRAKCSEERREKIGGRYRDEEQNSRDFKKNLAEESEDRFTTSACNSSFLAS